MGNSIILHFLNYIRSDPGKLKVRLENNVPNLGKPKFWPEFWVKRDKNEIFVKVSKGAVVEWD